MDKTIKTVGITVIIIVALFLAYQYIPQSEASTINVQGNSEITVDPDLARVWAGVSVSKDSADQAQNEVNEIVNNIVIKLQAEGFTQDDIETERISLYEEYDWTEGGRELKGWKAAQTLKIKTEDIDQVGKIVDIAVNNGANQINNIEFYLNEATEQEYKQQAVAQATTNAKEKAQTMANALDAKLGKIKSASEASFDYYPFRYAMEEVSGDAAISEAKAAVITPKDVTVSANIELVYEIK